jgi:hypothetical protein
MAGRLPLPVLFQPKRFAAQLKELFRAMHEQALTGRREIINLRGRRPIERQDGD